jgi:hypothetical protein
MGEGDIPIYATSSRSQRMALFVLWPKAGADLAQSSLYVVSSYRAHPSSRPFLSLTQDYISPRSPQPATVLPRLAELKGG